MVKRLLLLLLAICLIGCASGYFLKEGGLRPKNYLDKDYSRFLIESKNIHVTGLDTDAIYVSTSTLYINNKLKRFVPIDTLEKKWIYRFYDNGKSSYFNIYDKNLTRSDLNPRSGSMGFYRINNTQEIITSKYVTTPSGAMFRDQKLKLSNDTLYRVDTQDHVYGIFVKMKVPKDWLEFKPDW